jgi:MFS family permease
MPIDSPAEMEPALDDHPDAPRPKPATYRNYILVLLAVIFAFSYVDRIALGMVLQSIKSSFHLSDLELGFLTGMAYALFNATFGLAIGRWADTGNRALIVTLTTALWSVMVILCGAARSFLQLLILRIGVAVGEAGCFPPAYSLIGDYFTRAERPSAMSKYTLGGSLSWFIGYFAAGWLSQRYGWRWMFVIIGIPGILLAGLAKLALREPRVQISQQQSVFRTPTRQPAVVVIMRTLWANQTYRALLLSLSVLGFFASGAVQWQPAFFMRSYGMSAGELGTWLGVIWGVGGLLGNYTGGYIASRYAAGNESLQLRVLAVLYANFGIISVFIYLTHSRYIAFALLGVGVIGATLGNGPIYAAMQTVVPPNMRGVSVAIITLFSNLIGAGLGPLAVGALSDFLHPSLGAQSLRYALIAASPGYVWAAWHCWQGASSIPSHEPAFSSSQ